MNKILFLLGTLLLIVPFGLKVIDSVHQKDLISTYQKELKKMDVQEIETSIASAREYNEYLFKTKEMNLKRYESELNLFGNGMMGSLEIPKIDLKLPIYHGTKEEVLASGIGHLKESSLPVGNENSHSVLTGHRGLPDAQLFTRLDELEKGDVFFLKINNAVLNYRVCEVSIVKPENTEMLAIQAGKDLVSLVTCTPYGINTHRLVVTGERIAEREVAESDMEHQSISRRDFCFLLIPVLFFAIAIVRKRRRGGVRV